MFLLWYYVETKAESKKTIVALKDQWFNLTREIFSLKETNKEMENALSKTDERLRLLEANQGIN